LYQQTVIKVSNKKFHKNPPGGNCAQHEEKRTGGEISRKTETIELKGIFATTSEKVPNNCTFFSCSVLNPINAELNPICHLLALLEAYHILHVSSIRVKVFCIISGQTTIISETSLTD
jgi:hypothetical protein